eukprot:TRINITY_DN3056_c0_g1_i1.p1 TRINITY_DN3056_c0_g1~~TRINITY_DN3056_c0_g1_i1.p1  ORF type:complete len:414 (-),score=99.47 TRINITY_DN3056_c0_g1_i1:25-1140(-)
MGFMTWEKFRCNTDCANFPDTCISENLVLTQAKHLAQDGYLDAGYEFVIIDDCWPAKQRDSSTQRLVPDPDRFPNGMKHVADMLHSLGLKFGIYEDWGTLTCGGYPGSMNHEQLDADTFASWGVDYVKLDGCYSEISQQVAGYIKFGEALNATARPMVYSCSYPAYWKFTDVDFKLAGQHCNLWRYYDDIQDSWSSVKSIIQYASTSTVSEATVSWTLPGAWFDLDQLIIGDSLNLEESKSQMAVWAVLASPMLISADLTMISTEAKQILLNKEVIAVNQDPLGKAGYPVLTVNQTVMVFKRELAHGQFAVVLFNVGEQAVERSVVTLAQLGIQGSFDAVELFSGARSTGVTNLGGSVTQHGCLMFRLSPQ